MEKKYLLLSLILFIVYAPLYGKSKKDNVLGARAVTAKAAPQYGKNTKESDPSIVPRNIKYVKCR